MKVSKPKHLTLANDSNFKKSSYDNLVFFFHICHFHIYIYIYISMYIYIYIYIYIYFMAYFWTMFDAPPNTPQSLNSVFSPRLVALRKISLSYYLAHC